MNYDRSNASGRENKKYSSRHNYQSVRNTISDYIYSQQFRDAEEQRNRENAIRYNTEKGKTSQLIELGKLCGFIEFFDKIPLNEQEILPIEQIDNPRETESFKRGYTFAQTLIKNGFTEENYHSFERNYEKYPKGNQKHK